MADQRMNVYQKLLKARTAFLAAKVKKSGRNQHLKFDYFELDDIVPVATKIFAEVGLLPIVRFDSETATMQIVDAERPEDFITFTSPVVVLTQNGMNAVQALGAAETYQRRYLYYMALDICEPDTLDRDQPQQAAKHATKRTSQKPQENAAKGAPTQEPIISTEQVKAIVDKAVAEAGVNREKFLPWVKKAFHKPLEQMNGDEAANVMLWINRQAEKRMVQNGA